MFVQLALIFSHERRRIRTRSSLDIESFEESCLRIEWEDLNKYENMIELLLFFYSCVVHVFVLSIVVLCLCFVYIDTLWSMLCIWRRTKRIKTHFNEISNTSYGIRYQISCHAWCILMRLLKNLHPCHVNQSKNISSLNVKG